MTLIVIPARGGSKGIPRKNLVTLGDDLPLVVRAVRKAAIAGLGRVLVSSDDDEICAAILAMNFESVCIRIRPPELAQDRSSSESVLEDALNWYQHHHGPTEHVILMQCTTPFTSVGDIQAIDGYLKTGIKCAFSTTPFRGFLWTRPGSGRSLPLDHDPGAPRKRRQDMAGRLQENGALYGMEVAAFRATGSRFCDPNPQLYVMPGERSIEIDEPWQLAAARGMVEYADR